MVARAIYIIVSILLCLCHVTTFPFLLLLPVYLIEGLNVTHADVACASGKPFLSYFQSMNSERNCLYSGTCNDATLFFEHAGFSTQ